MFLLRISAVFKLGLVKYGHGIEIFLKSTAKIRKLYISPKFQSSINTSTISSSLQSTIYKFLWLYTATKKIWADKEIPVSKDLLGVRQQGKATGQAQGGSLQAYSLICYSTACFVLESDQKYWNSFLFVKTSRHGWLTTDIWAVFPSHSII